MTRDLNEEEREVERRIRQKLLGPSRYSTVVEVRRSKKRSDFQRRPMDLTGLKTCLDEEGNE